MVEVRTGKSSATYFTVNGVDLGHMSNAGNPETWLFAPPDRAGAHRPALTDRMGTPGARLEDLAQRLQVTCLASAITVATAESCTGGLVAHAITSQPGSSGYYVGGVVSYSNEVKSIALGVPTEVLAAHGAVSAQVAVAMAAGVRERLGAAVLGVGVTGVAGPDGGTPDKPVGLVYIAVADGAGTDVRRFLWPGDRASNIEDSAAAALELLLERATQATAVPPVGAS